MPFRMPPMPFPMPPLFITALKDIYSAINTFEKLLNILFSEVYCKHFGFTILLFSATITGMSSYELLNLFSRWPLVFRSMMNNSRLDRVVKFDWKWPRKIHLKLATVNRQKSQLKVRMVDTFPFFLIFYQETRFKLMARLIIRIWQWPVGLMSSK